MGEGDVAAILRQTMLVVLKIGGPVLIAALAVGVVMSVVQAVTQINEATLAFVPKALVIIATLALAGPFMLGTIDDFTKSLVDQMVAAGGL